MASPTEHVARISTSPHRAIIGTLGGLIVSSDDLAVSPGCQVAQHPDVRAIADGPHTAVAKGKQAHARVRTAKTSIRIVGRIHGPTSHRRRGGSRTLWGNKGISHGVGGTALGRIWNRISDTEAVPTGDPAKTIGITIKDAAVRSRATRIEVPDGNVLFPEQEGLAGS